MNIYFTLEAANAADDAQLQVVLASKKFYPESTSVPALPISFDNSFDYRQFLIYLGRDKAGKHLVVTRKQYSVLEFNTNVIPTADWTSRYRLSVAPTVSESDYAEIVNGNNYATSYHTFLSYDYKDFTNNK